jgi:hypothetical protein
VTLLGVLGEARSPEGRTAAAAYRRVAHRFSASNEPARVSHLQLAALQAGAESLVRKPDIAAPDRTESPQWWPLWGWWQPATPSRMLGRLSADAGAVAVTKVGDMPLVVVGGPFGIEVWEMRSARRLAFQPWKITTLTIGYAKGRPVVLAGHNDSSVAVHGLPSLAVLARNDTAHSGKVLATVAGDGSVAVTGDEEGTLVLWRLPALERDRIRTKAHTMVRALAATKLDGAPLLVSAGDTITRNGFRNAKVAPVRVWRLPTAANSSGTSSGTYSVITNKRLLISGRVRIDW